LEKFNTLMQKQKRFTCGAVAPEWCLGGPSDAALHNACKLPGKKEISICWGTARDTNIRLRSGQGMPWLRIFALTD
jgi:hypothetical protein